MFRYLLSFNYVIQNNLDIWDKLYNIILIIFIINRSIKIIFVINYMISKNLMT